MDACVPSGSFSRTLHAPGSYNIGIQFVTQIPGNLLSLLTQKDLVVLLRLLINLSWSRHIDIISVQNLYIPHICQITMHTLNVETRQCCKACSVISHLMTSVETLPVVFIVPHQLELLYIDV